MLSFLSVRRINGQAVVDRGGGQTFPPAGLDNLLSHKHTEKWSYGGRTNLHLGLQQELCQIRNSETARTVQQIFTLVGRG